MKHLRRFHSNSLLTATALTHLAGLCSLDELAVEHSPLDMSIDYLTEMRWSIPLRLSVSWLWDERNVTPGIAFSQPLFMTCPLNSLEFMF